MPVKDYYKILELPPDADLASVKRNFRRLAIRFHPDTNGGEPRNEAWYREIKEAYETLTHPVKKAQYLQERWLQKSKGLPFEETTPLTPEFIERKFRNMRITVNNMDHFRMDHQQLQQELVALCNDDNLEALQKYHDPHINTIIIRHLKHCMEPLDYKWIHQLKIPMGKIAGRQPELALELSDWFEKRKREYGWQKYQGWVIALISLLICASIAWFTGQGK